jgi:DNA-binding CsgD family transcriptional regulator
MLGASTSWLILRSTATLVAHDLYISIKTVEFHISQILARLGIDHRGDSAAALAGHGQVSAGATAAG